MIHLTKSNHVKYLVGGKTISTQPLVPFDEMVCGLLNDLSTDLRSNKKAKLYPDIITFAFWCRKANISKQKKDFFDGKVRLGLGLVFHITPSNVAINFAYSFVFGLLSGNANIVRLPSRLFPHVDIICSAINKLFRFKKKPVDSFFLKNSLTTYLNTENYGSCISAVRRSWAMIQVSRTIRRLYSFDFWHLERLILIRVRIIKDIVKNPISLIPFW